MQNVEFDIHGNIKPYVMLPLGIDDFKQDFVNAMPYSERRGILFDTFLRHLTDFKTDIDEAFMVWVGGSFVTRKTNPSDIDCVVFLDAECYNRYEERANLLRQERYRPQKLMDVFLCRFIQQTTAGEIGMNQIDCAGYTTLAPIWQDRRKESSNLTFNTMDELTHLLEDTDLRAAAIARLLALIEQDSDIISRHRLAGESGSYVQQYVELRAANLATLAHLLEGRGTIRVDLRVSEQAV